MKKIIILMLLALVSKSQTYIKLKQLEPAAGAGSVIVTNGSGIPTYSTLNTAGSFTAYAPLSLNSGSLTISQANTSQDGYLNFGDWNTFNSKQSQLNGTGFVKSTGTVTSYVTEVGTGSVVLHTLPSFSSGIGTPVVYSAISGASNLTLSLRSATGLGKGKITFGITSAGSYYDETTFRLGLGLASNTATARLHIGAAIGSGTVPALRMDSQTTPTASTFGDIWADGNGYNFASGNLISSGFKTPIGTSSQFLKADGSVDASTYLTGSTGWSILGNSGTTAGTNFLGTTDAQDLVLKTNNTTRFTLKSNGVFNFAATTSTGTTVGDQWYNSTTYGLSLLTSSTGATWGRSHYNTGGVIMFDLPFGNGTNYAHGGWVGTASAHNYGIITNGNSGGVPSVIVTGEGIGQQGALLINPVPAASGNYSPVAMEEIIAGATTVAFRTNTYTGSGVSTVITPIVEFNTLSNRFTKPIRIGSQTAPTKTLDVTGDAAVSSSLTVGGNLITSGSSTTTGNAQITGSTNITSSLVVGSTSTLTGAFLASSTGTVTGNLLASSNFTTSGNALVTGSMNITNSVTISGTLSDILTVSGSGGSGQRSGIKCYASNSAGQATNYMFNDRNSTASYGGQIYGCTSNADGNLFGVSRVDKYFIFSDGASNAGMALGNLANQYLILGTNNTERIRILAGGAVGVGVSAPTRTLEVGGTFAATGASTLTSVSTSYVAKTANYTVTTTDYTIDCTANTFTVTLPAAASNTGRMYVIKNSGAGTITVQGNGAELIDAANTKSLSVQYSGVVVQSTGSKFIVIGSF